MGCVPILMGVSRKSSIPVLAAEGLGAPSPSGYGRDAGTQRLGGGIAPFVFWCRPAGRTALPHT